MSLGVEGSIASLGLRIDENGMVVGADRARDALGRLGNESTKVQGKLQNFATNAAFSVSQFASSANRDFTSILRSATSLGFAMGGTVGTFALLGSSIVDIWSDTRRRTREQQQKMIQDMREMERSFTPRAMLERIGSLGTRERTLSTRLEGLQSMDSALAVRALTDPVGAAFAKIQNMMEVSDVSAQLEQTRQARHDLNQAYRELVRELKQEVADRRQFYTRDIVVSGMERAASIAAVNPFDAYAGIEEKALAAVNRASLDMDKEKARILSEYSGEALALAKERLELEHRLLLAMIDQERVADRAMVKQNQKVSAKASLGAYGMGLASQAGPFGPMLAGVGSSLMVGDPYGAAAAGVIGLVDGLMSLAGASARAAEAARRQRVEYEAFADRVRLQLGDITESQADINQIRRDFEERRRDVTESFYARATAQTRGLTAAEQKEMQRQLAELTEWERRLIEQRSREADELDRLTTAYRNAPSGFFVEQYLGAHAERLSWGGRASSGPGGMSVTVAAGAIVIHGAGDGTGIARRIIEDLERAANAIGGAGSPSSAALDLLN